MLYKWIKWLNNEGRSNFEDFRPTQSNVSCHRWKERKNLMCSRVSASSGKFLMSNFNVPLPTTFKERSPSSYGTYWKNIFSRVVRTDVEKEVLSLSGRRVNRSKLGVRESCGLPGAKMPEPVSFQRILSPSQFVLLVVFQIQTESPILVAFSLISRRDT